jgi:hypothetical protein
VLVAAVTAGSAGSGALPDPDLLQVIGTMPMSTLAGFGMGGFSHELLDQVVEQL